MSKRILVTGGAGFIGCHLARPLLASGHEVLVFDNLHPQVHTAHGLPRDLPSGVQFVSGDVTSETNFRSLFRYYRPDVVVHLAAETGTGQSLTESHRHVGVNVDGTAQLLDALAAVGHVPEHFVLTSSRAVYGDGAWLDTGTNEIFYPDGRTRSQLERAQWDHLGPSGERARAVPSLVSKTHPNPISVYGATKLAQEHVLAAWCRAFGSALSVFRLQNVYGPGQAPGNPYTGVLVLFARWAREGRTLDIYEDGQIVRDFVHVEDVVQALTKTIATPPAGIRLLDIGSGVPETIATAANLVAALYGAPTPIVSGKFRDGDVRAASCDISPAVSAIGFAPKWGLEAGLASIKPWLEVMLEATSA